MRALFLSLAMLLTAAQAVASATAIDQHYTVSISGIRAGDLYLRAEINGSRYAANGVLKSSGLVGFFAKVNFDGKVTGSYQNGRFFPSQYVGTGESGSAGSTVDIRYSGGKPTRVITAPPKELKPYELQPATQGGTVDPVTATLSLLRDVPKEGLCNRKVDIFDGARRSRISLGKPTQDGSLQSCNGSYSRVAGFSEELMAKQVSFPFSIWYEDAGDGMMRVVRFTTATTFGTAKVERKK